MSRREDSYVKIAGVLPPRHAARRNVKFTHTSRTECIPRVLLYTCGMVMLCGWRRTGRGRVSYRCSATRRSPAPRAAAAVLSMSSVGSGAGLNSTRRIGMARLADCWCQRGGAGRRLGVPPSPAQPQRLLPCRCCASAGGSSARSTDGEDPKMIQISDLSDGSIIRNV